MSENREALTEDAKPATENKPVLVETEGFQCMAYQDCYGKWRSFYGLELLRGKVEVVKLEENDR